MKNNIVFSYLLISTALTTFGQTNADEIQKWQTLAKENEARAVRAEKALKYAEADVKRMRYLAVAYEIAERSVEVADRELSALLAVLSHNFNNRYGNTFNSKTYAALSEAIKRYEHFYNNRELTTKSLGADTKSTSATMPNSQTTVEAEQNGNLRLLSEGITKMTLSGHREQVDQIRFNQAGTLMITAGKDNTIRIWNIRQLNLRPLVITESFTIGNLTVSPDDKQIIYTISTEPKTTKVQYLDSEVMAAELCKYITRNLTLDQWQIYVASDLEYESVCKQPPAK